MRKFSILFSALMLVASIAPAQLQITEYGEGFSNFKYLEIKNTTASPIDLASPVQYSVRRYTNGAATVGATINLTGTIAAGDFFVIANNATDFDTNTFGFPADQYNTGINHNGNDFYDIFDGTSIIDGFGKDQADGTDPGTLAQDCIVFRRNDALPNNGDYGATNNADSTNSASGFWYKRTIATNLAAVGVATPGAGGGQGGIEVPVELSGFSLD